MGFNIISDVLDYINLFDNTLKFKLLSAEVMFKYIKPKTINNYKFPEYFVKYVSQNYSDPTSINDIPDWPDGALYNG